MNRHAMLLAACLLGSGCGLGPETGSVRPAESPSAAARPVAAEPAPDWELVWRDEFDGPAIDTTKWTHVVGGGGFGNNERQYYTASPANSFIRDGKLVIHAMPEDREGHPYTSSKLHSQHKGDWTYGRFEIRALLPFGQGIWPAIWMMPTDYNKYGPWPSCGEIDIMEMVGHLPGTVHGTLHYGNPRKYTGSHFALPDGARFADGFHLFGLEWAPGEIKWFVDGQLYQTQNDWYTSAPGALWPAPFDRDFYLQLNLAVGGNWPGYPDATTTFPQEMEIDYVRVHRFSGEYPPVESRPASAREFRPRDPLPDGNHIFDGDTLTPF